MNVLRTSTSNKGTAEYMTIRPFFPWMGSKRLLVKQLVGKVPASYERYIEPFLGSGALLYALGPAQALASDVLAPVIELHKAVADDPQGFADAYRTLSVGADRETTFHAIRSRYPDISPPEFLYLLKHSHGSRFRVNSRGQFNSPLNRSPLKPSEVSERQLAVDFKAILAAGQIGQRVDFAKADFTERLLLAKPGDFIFMDPPYRWQAGREADYGGQWGAEDWKRLVACLVRLPPGVFIMITLHGSMPLEEVRELLAEVPDIHVEALALNGCHLRKGGMEGRTEWLARNYNHAITPASLSPGRRRAACPPGPSAPVHQQCRRAPGG